MPTVLRRISLVFQVLCALASSNAFFGKFRLAPNSPQLPLPLLAGRSSSEGSPSCLPLIEYHGEEPPSRALILVDGFCHYHGAYVASGSGRYPCVAVVRVLSEYLRKYLEATQPDEDWGKMQLPSIERELEEWKRGLGGMEVVGVYCESDSGLSDAETLREVLGASCQDDPVCLEARRNKFLMNERVGKYGLAVAQQRLCESLEEALSFAGSLLKDGRKVVVKPHRGVASESVNLCESMEDVEETWERITSTVVFGSGSAERHSTVLVQEFLEGVEYALDVVSRDGQHKIAAIWRYDKRPANGSPFLYFQTRLVDLMSDEGVAVVGEYALDALNALGVKWGVSHNEVILTATGPVLVEINCRQHNMDFCPLTMACIGYNALDMTVDAFLGTDEDWLQYPDSPMLRASGCMVHLVNYQAGRVVHLHHAQDIATLPSVLDMEVYADFLPGEIVTPTVDIRSDAGWVQMIHPEAAGLQADYEKITAWMPTMFEIEEETEAS